MIQPSKPCPRGACSGFLFEELSEDGSCYECERCSVCGARWWYDPPKPAGGASVMTAGPRPETPEEAHERGRREMAEACASVVGATMFRYGDLVKEGAPTLREIAERSHHYKGAQGVASALFAYLTACGFRGLDAGGEITPEDWPKVREWLSDQANGIPEPTPGEQA